MRLQQCCTVRSAPVCIFALTRVPKGTRPPSWKILGDDFFFPTWQTLWQTSLGSNINIQTTSKWDIIHLRLCHFKRNTLPIPSRAWKSTLPLAGCEVSSHVPTQFGHSSNYLACTTISSRISDSCRSSFSRCPRCMIRHQRRPNRQPQHPNVPQLHRLPNHASQRHTLLLGLRRLHRQQLGRIHRQQPMHLP